jgi:hypothetical protein
VVAWLYFSALKIEATYFFEILVNYHTTQHQIPGDGTLKEKTVCNMETYHLCHSPPLNVVSLQELHPSLPKQTNPLYRESCYYCYVTAGVFHTDALAAVFQSLYDFLPHSETGVTNN